MQDLAGYKISGVQDLAGCKICGVQDLAGYKIWGVKDLAGTRSRRVKKFRGEGGSYSGTFLCRKPFKCLQPIDTSVGMESLL